MSQIWPLGHQLATSDPPHTAGSFLCPVWRLVPLKSSPFIGRPKCTIRLESETVHPAVRLSCTLSCAPPPQLPFQASPCHGDDWHGGKGRDNAPGSHCNPQGAEARSPLHLGVLEQWSYLFYKDPLRDSRPEGYQREEDIQGHSEKGRSDH